MADERAPLGLEDLDDPVLPSGQSPLVAAAIGMAKLALAHVARRLVVDDDAPALTRKDRLALALAPRIGIDVDHAGRPQRDESGPDDPIMALLDESCPGVVTAQLELGPPRPDAADES